MNNKLYISGIVLVLLVMVTSGCGTATIKPTTGLATPPSILEIATDPPEATASPISVLSIEETPTQIPEPTPLPAEDDPYPGWASYANPDYGFAFRYPASWTLEEEANLVKLSRGPLLLAIFFQRQGADARPPWTGMPAGAFESRDAPAFMGQEIDSHSLIYEGKVKVLTYGAEVGDVFYAIRLDDMTTADYQAIDITATIQDEVDRIVGSFVLPESGGK